MQVLEQIFSGQILTIILLSAFYGVFMGAVPGLTATMAVALIVPVTFFMDPLPALAAIVTLEACAIFAGDIPNALLRIPGTPSSAAYADDAYALTQAGRSQTALGTCLVFSVAGGLFGAAILAAFAPQLARVATCFTVVEYFWLYLLGLSCAVVVSRGSLTKGTLSLLIGLLLSTVGLSAVHTQARFTFGRPELYQGINFIPAMIGLFGLSEVLRNAVRLKKESTAEIEQTKTTQQNDPLHKGENNGLNRKEAPPPAASSPSAGGEVAPAQEGVFTNSLPLLWRRKWHTLRSGLLGSLIGMLPGAGADIGAWVSLAVSKRFSKHPERYGHGSLEGVADATAANNAALAGAWIPSLVFGIPGDSVTAIVIGVLLMKNVKPGPDIFEKQASLVYGIYLMFVLANLILVPVGFLAIKLGSYVVRVSRRVLLPPILLFCILGAYAINGSYFDVGVMLAMGLLGFVLEYYEVPLGPVVLGILLGGPLEERFVQTLSGANGNPAAFFSRPLAAVLGTVCILLWVGPTVARLRTWILHTRKVT